MDGAWSVWDYVLLSRPPALIRSSYLCDTGDWTRIHGLISTVKVTRSDSLLITYPTLVINCIKKCTNKHMGCIDNGLQKDYGFIIHVVQHAAPQTTRPHSRVKDETLTMIK